MNENKGTYSKDKPGTLTITIREVDRAVWKAFRARCLEEDIPASDKVRELITEHAARKEGGE